MKVIKRFISGLTAFAMATGLIVVPIGENYDSIFSNNAVITAYATDSTIMPTLDSESAAVFVAFLANDGNMSTEKIQSSLAYQLMTDKYDGDDKTILLEGLYQYITMSTSIRAGTADSNKSYLSNKLVEYLEKKANGNEADDILNGYKQDVSDEIFDNLLEDLSSFFFTPVVSESLELGDSWRTISGVTGKAEKWVEELITAFLAYGFVIESENCGRYNYFDAYISLRKNYSSANDDTFQILLAQNKLASNENNLFAGMIDVVNKLCLSDKNSYKNHYDVIDSWAEYTFQLHDYTCYRIGIEASGIEEYKDENGFKTGDKFALGNYTYKVLSPYEHTVQIFQYNGSDTNIQLPTTVVYGGISYKIDGISNSAFSQDQTINISKATQLDKDLNVPCNVNISANLDLNGYCLSVTGNVTNNASITFNDGEIRINGDFRNNRSLNLSNGKLYVNGNFTQYGDYITDLSGGYLYVYGNYNHKDGQLIINEGLLEINGNYLVDYHDSFDYGNNRGTITMNKTLDRIVVHGNFTSQSQNTHKLTNGTLTIYGNLTSYKAVYGPYSGRANFQSKALHTLVFKGDYLHNITFDSTGEYIGRISLIDGATITFTNQFSGFTLYNDLSIEGDTSLNGGTLNLNGHTLTINGNFTNYSNINVNNGHLIINGDCTVRSNFNANRGITDVYGNMNVSSGGTVDISYGLIEVHGNVNQTDGRMLPNNGTLSVDNNYVINYSNTLDYGGVLGTITMNQPYDRIIISGDFTNNNSRNSNTFTNGIMTIGGNLTSRKPYEKSYGFYSKDNHVLIFKGDKLHSINFSDTSEKIGRVILQDDARIKFSNSFGGFTLMNDLTIDDTTSLNGGNLDLNGYTLTINGDFTNYGVLQINGGRLIVNGDYTVRSSVNVNSGEIDVNGNMNLSSGGNVDIDSGLINILGSVSQTGGRMIPNNGTLIVEKNYNINYSNSLDYGGVLGTITMNQPDDKIIIGGNFNNYNRRNTNSFSEGELRIGGNIYSVKPYEKTYGFNSTGNHKVVLFGEGSKTITFDNGSFRIATLELLQPKNNYKFTKEPCWNTLIEKYKYIEKETHSVTLGDNISINYYEDFVDDISKPVMSVWLDDNKIQVPGILQSDGRYKFAYSVAAPQMTEVVYNTITAQKNGEEITTDVYSYSVREYGEAVIKSESTSKTMKDLAAQMLNYGAYTQLYFGYNTDDLANKNLTELGYSTTLDDSVINLSAEATFDPFDGETKAKFTTNSLIFESDTALKYYITMDEKFDNAYMAYRVKDSGDEYSYIPLTPNGDRYYATIKGIKTPLLTDYYETFVCIKEDETYTQISDTKYYSPECYASAIYQKSKSESMKNAVVAMMMYCKASRIHFKLDQ